MLLVDFAVENGSQAQCYVLSNGPKYKKVTMSLAEKIHILDELRSGMSYSAAGHGFNVN